MDRVATMPANERAELIRLASDRLGDDMPPAVVEKDFWVCWSLTSAKRHDGRNPISRRRNQQSVLMCRRSAVTPQTKLREVIGLKFHEVDLGVDLR
jgi:hypothetical protein